MMSFLTVVTQSKGSFRALTSMCHKTPRVQFQICCNWNLLSHLTLTYEYVWLSFSRRLQIWVGPSRPSSRRKLFLWPWTAKISWPEPGQGRERLLRTLYLSYSASFPPNRWGQHKSGLFSWQVIFPSFSSSWPLLLCLMSSECLRAGCQGSGPGPNQRAGPTGPDHDQTANGVLLKGRQGGRHLWEGWLVGAEVSSSRHCIKCSIVFCHEPWH